MRSNARPLAVFAAIALLSACAATGGGPAADASSTTGSTAAAGEITYQPTAGLTAQQRFREALALLEKGNPGQAGAELEAYLQERPRSRIAADLLAQIEAAAAYFPPDHFTVELESGESLSTLSKKYFGSVYKFYALARYNNIDVPRNTRIGQTVKIPLTDESVAARDAAENTAAGGDSPPAGPAADPVDALAGAAEDIPAESPGQAPPAEITPSDILAAHVDAGEYELAIASLDSFSNGLSDEDQQLAILALLSSADEMEAAGENVTAAGRFVRAADMLQATGEMDRALDAYRSAVNLNPADFKTADAYANLRKDLADKYHRQASKAFRAQELDTAIEIWDRVLEIDENHANAQVYRAQALELKARLSSLNE